MAEFNPRSAGIARKIAVHNSPALVLRVEDPIAIIHIRAPTRRLGCFSIDGQSDVLAPLDFGVVFINVGQSLVDLPESFARRYWQVVKVNPFVITCAGIARKIFGPSLITPVIFGVKDL